MAVGVMEGMSIHIVEVTTLGVQKRTDACATERHTGRSLFMTSWRVKARMYRVDNVRLGFHLSAVSMGIGPDFGLDARGIITDLGNQVKKRYWEWGRSQGANGKSLGGGVL